MKRKRNGKKKSNLISLHIYGIFSKKKNTIVKVGLDKEEILFDLELDNHDDDLELCSFDVKVNFDD